MNTLVVLETYVGENSSLRVTRWLENKNIEAVHPSKTRFQGNPRRRNDSQGNQTIRNQKKKKGY